MAHHHSEEHHAGHSHSHAPVVTNLNKAFVVGIVLNLAYVLIQVVIGLKINSLSLLSDAGHNFLDVAGLALAMLAFKLAKSKSTEKYTYGYRKASILISLLNAVVLLISIGAIAYEAAFRFKYPQQLPGTTIAIIAAIGIVINAVSAFMFFRDRENDINVKSAFLHLASDALVSLGLVVGGIIIHYTQLYWIDPLLSIIICLVIIASTWSLLKDSLRLSLDGVPENIDVQKIKTAALQVAGVKDIHHLHVWAISTNRNALTAHIILDNSTTMLQAQQVKEKLKHELEHLNIHHVTLETEVLEKPCTENDC
ncbi:cation diffusion facilitator family transporter [Ferruginibacter sp. SUN106]|uniref:cation diffusion facilitator family transporter n=1 Tax=Ferruginibacter sp. SUN106 TaxID=2978348 RepID=UPI003D35C8E2